MRWSDFLIFNGRVAMAAILANRLRSALTLLGMLIGVMCVTLVLSFSQAIKKNVGDALEGFGGNMAILSRDTSSRGRTVVLSLQEMAVIATYFPQSHVAPFLSSERYVYHDGEYEKTEVWGVTPEYFAVRKMKLVAGRWLAPEELYSGARIMLMSKGLKETVFGKEKSGVGEIVKIENIPYLVAGIISDPSASLTIGNDYKVFMPFQTVRQRFYVDRLIRPDYVEAAFINFGPRTSLADGAEQLKALLRQRYYVTDKEDFPFSINTTQEAMDKVTKTIGTMQLALMAIASVSLLVGGIGIMNIMLVSVAERTREIGIRMAVGAPPHVIRAQFLMEAALLCLLGGIAGMLLADLALTAISKSADMDLSLDIGTALFVAGFSILVGLIAGYVPAARASRLDPVEALRSA